MQALLLTSHLTSPKLEIHKLMLNYERNSNYFTFLFSFLLSTNDDDDAVHHGNEVELRMPGFLPMQHLQQPQISRRLISRRFRLGRDLIDR